MKLKIKRFDKEIPMPVYKTGGAVALDLYSRLVTVILPKEVKLIPLNVAIEIPKGYFGLLTNRSSTFKLGITCVNGVGIIDSDFRGDSDEILFPALNFTDTKVIIEKGTRCCQILILPVSQGEVIEVDKLENIDRGGFGTTGNK